jgi:hypothetical protein
MKYHVIFFSIALLTIAFCVSALPAFGQGSTVGVYLTFKNKKRCQNQAVNLEEKKYCLAPQPVLTSDDMSHITAINTDLTNQLYFNLVFKESGVAKLKNLSKAFPNSQIVLVVDKIIVGFLKDLDVLKSNQLKMTAGTEPGKDLEFVHEKLKGVLPIRK